MDLKNYVSKVVGSSSFCLSKSLKNYCNSIVMKGVRMKPPKDIMYVLVECNSFLTLPRQMKGCLIMIYIQVIISDSEEINKD